ncbi:unnamed protein product [Penicillium viridicatum]
MPDQQFDVFRNMQIYMDKLVDHVRKNFRPNGRPRLCWYAQHPLADGKKALRRSPCVRLTRAMKPACCQFSPISLARAPSPAVIVANWMQAGTEFYFWRRLQFHCVLDSVLDKLGYNLPDPATVTLYKITPQVTSSDDFDAWEAMVVKQLRGLQLHNLIDDKVDRPDRDDPYATRWVEHTLLTLTNL